MGVECIGENCAFGVDDAKRCDNRHFTNAEKGDYDGGFEVFYTGSAKGFGLRATRDLESCRLIAEYLGDVVERRNLRSWRYAMTLKAGICIDASKAGGPARFMNHSCSPNCYAQRWAVNGEWRIGLFAARSISKGEEFTFSYAHSCRGFGEKNAPEVCHCGEPICSGAIGITPSSRPRKREAPPLRSVAPAPKQHPQGQAAAALAERLAAARSDGPPSWPHAQWLSEMLFGQPGPELSSKVCRSSTGCGSDASQVAAVLQTSCAYTLEPFFANPWPRGPELALARAHGLFLPRTLAHGRRAWAHRLRDLPEMPRDLAALLCEAVTGGEPCAECGSSTGLDGQCCVVCSRALHRTCGRRARGRPSRAMASAVKCVVCAKASAASAHAPPGAQRLR